MLSDAQIQEFKGNGVLLGPRVYTSGECDRLWERLMEILAGRSATRPESMRNLLGASEKVVIQIVNVWRADSLFHRHVFNPVVCELVSQLMGSSVIRLWHDQVQYKPARIGGPTTWHQDYPFWPVIQPSDVVTAWIPLVDATSENGCLFVVPGSHRWGVHKRGIIGTAGNSFMPTPDLTVLPDSASVDVRCCAVEKGRVLFHHCLTWHGSGNKSSGVGRPAIAAHYMPGYTRYEPDRTHFLQRRITVKQGEVLEGEYFPVVWDHGPCKFVPVEMSSARRGN